ncbi:sodium- and chloride-dependent glycine transporter 1-like [Diadema setosum]|uniref:sodium- and chloride-dependent glycine transporter 1-like n=1 Tax=Diadema setosum TaxID=31175 RepID=UPI003B3B31F1
MPSKPKTMLSVNKWFKRGRGRDDAAKAEAGYTAVGHTENGPKDAVYPPEESKGKEAHLDGEVNQFDAEKETENERGTWGSGMEFILSTMGYAIGLGNVWRFPYMAYENGGGAFLLPYIIMLLIVCFPIMFMEMGLGQFSSLGCISVWRISPLFKGIGYAMALVSAYFCFYYNIIIAYSIFYMFASMQGELPWRGCNHTWNTPNCFEGSRSSNVSFGDNTTERVWATEEYWKHFVLDQTNGLHDMGTIRWQLLLCFLATWIIVYLCIIKGVKTSGKVVYFTATFPFLVLFILLIRGATLEGAGQGILYFIKPRFEKLKEAKVWLSAANQVFLSYGAGWGGFLTLSSYNKFNKHCIRDAIIIVISGSFTSILAGFVIFAVLGFMAHDAGADIEDVVSSGPGLAFVAYPEALSRLPLPQLWAFLFFFMLLTLGLDSEFVTLETCITALVDEFKDDYPILHKKRYFVILGTCIFMLFLGLPLTTQGGVYVFELFNWYSAGFTPMIIVIFEAIAVSYVYGGRRFLKDISYMIGDVPFVWWWMAMWYAVVPIFIVVIMIFGFVDQVPAYYDDYVFPPWAQAIGWSLTMSSIVLIFVYAAYIVIRQKSGSLMERLRVTSRPSELWGPALPENREKAGYPPIPNRNKFELKVVDQKV